METPALRDEDTERFTSEMMYRLRQFKKLVALFEEAQGRPARNCVEVCEWLTSPEGKWATAYDTDPKGEIIPDLAD